MPMPSKKRNAAMLREEQGQTTTPSSSPATPATPPTTTSSPRPVKWLPAGFKSTGALSDGVHVCQIVDIGSFTTKSKGDYVVKLDLKTTAGEEGSHRITFFQDPQMGELTARNSALISTILSVAGMHVGPGVEPNWLELTVRLQDVRFEVEVASSKRGCPFIASLNPISCARATPQRHPRTETVESDVIIDDDPNDQDLHEDDFR